MKQFVRSVPAVLFMGAASLSMIVLAGCGSSGHPKAAKSVYGINYSYNETTDIEQDSVVGFSASAKGSTTPTSTLMLPSNFDAYSLVVGPKGEIYVGGYQDGDNDNNYGEILKYAAGSSGSATPEVTLNGGTGTFDYPDSLAVNSAGTLVVAADDSSLESFAAGFTASSAPTQYLTWGQQTNPNTEDAYFGDSGDPIGIDTAGDIFYMDGDYGVIDVFTAGAMGATAPARMITGTSDTTTFYDLYAIAVDGAGDVYVSNYNDSGNSQPGTEPGTYAASKRGRGRTAHSASQLTAHPHNDETYELTGIIEFAAGATGNATPTKRIGGSATNISEPAWGGLAVDAASNLYYADYNGLYNTGDFTTPMLLEFFSASATGNVAPAASITSMGYTVNYGYEPLGIH